MPTFLELAKRTRTKTFADLAKDEPDILGSVQEAAKKIVQPEITINKNKTFYELAGRVLANIPQVPTEVANTEASYKGISPTALPRATEISKQAKNIALDIIGRKGLLGMLADPEGSRVAYEREQELLSKPYQQLTSDEQREVAQGMTFTAMGVLNPAEGLGGGGASAINKNIKNIIKQGVREGKTTEEILASLPKLVKPKEVGLLKLSKKELEIMKAEKPFVEDFIKKYPTKEDYINAQKGKIYKDSLGRETQFSGQEHEIRNAETYYNAVQDRVKKYNITPPIPNERVKVYRGEGYGSGKNYYTTNKEFANEFAGTKPLTETTIPKNIIYRPKELPMATSEKEVTNAINEAKQKGFKAVYVSEGEPFGEPVESIFVFDKTPTPSTPAIGEAGKGIIPPTKPPAPPIQPPISVFRDMQLAKKFPSKGLSQELKNVVGGIKNPEFQNAAINNIMKALQEAKPLRGQQEALYSAERAQRIAKVVAIGEKVPGQAGLYAQLGQLKGEMPKVQFESIKGKITQSHVDALFQKIWDNQILSVFEKINARKALDKLVAGRGGSLPTRGEISLLSEIFPPEFIKTVMEKRPIMEKLSNLGGQMINLPRAMMATADLSAPLRQGIFLVGRPKQWGPAFRDMFKYAFNEKSYIGLMEEIKLRPTYKQMHESGLSLTEMGTDMLKREEMFMSNLSEKIPIFGALARGSNRAYSGFLNKLRADVFDDLLRSAEKLGVTKERPEVVKDIAKFVNSATGRGEYRSPTAQKLLVATNGIFFSPRLMASRLNLLNPHYYATLDPFVRKEALKSLFTFAGTAGTVLGLAKLGGADVGIDPRSSDFGKVKIGNTRFDTLGGFQQYIVAATRLLTNQMVSSTTGKQFNLGEGWKPTTRADIIQRFFESKGSPVASFALALIKGKDFGGGKIDVPVEIVDRFIPMLAQDIYDLYKEYGLSGVAMGIPGAFGIGSQTYGEQIPLETKTATGKPTIQWKQRPGLGEDIVNIVRRVEVKPVPVKAIYDKAQDLLKQGKQDEADKLVNELSDNDYELYKKFKQRDAKIAKDEMKIKMEPIYKQVQGLKKIGNETAAQNIVDNLTDEEYEAYEFFREKDYKLIQ